MKYFSIEYTADVEGNWCSDCAEWLYSSQSAAEAAIQSDPTSKPDEEGNRCYPVVVSVASDEDDDVYWRGTWRAARDLLRDGA